jgi:CPA1 family monovalent cation:H+ antiporter
VADVELVIFFLLIAVAVFGAVARVLDVPYPIALVVGGSLVGFAPGVPEVVLDPDLVLLIFLPPLLFNLAYFSSVRDLRAAMRVIALDAIGLVLLTTCLVAVVVHAAVDGLPWAAAFALGAIVSPTDPLAATAILRRQNVPRRLTSTLEGESLVNDGTALVAYRTAVAAATGGTFDLLDASGDFALNAVGGVGVGVIAGVALLWVLRRLVGDDIVGVTISLGAGYLAYLPAEHIGVSGVLAAVTVGLIVGHRSSELSTAAGRLRGYAFWEVLVFLLNAVLFLLVGLQLPTILDSQDRSALSLIGLGLLVGGVVIGARLVWLHTTPYVIRALDRRPSQVERRVGWRARMLGVWAGLRGSVSLAAALALPADFPERDLLIFLTLAVIFATLVAQGLTLPWLIRRMDVPDDGVSTREELIARKAAAQAAMDHLETLRGEEWARDDTIERMTGLYSFRRRRLLQRIGYNDAEDENLDERSHDYQRLVHEVIGAQRRRVIGLRDEGAISDEVLYALERELDLEEARLEV